MWVEPYGRYSKRSLGIINGDGLDQTVTNDELPSAGMRGRTFAAQGWPFLQAFVWWTGNMALNHDRDGDCLRFTTPIAGLHYVSAERNGTWGRGASANKSSARRPPPAKREYRMTGVFSWPHNRAIQIQLQGGRFMNERHSLDWNKEERWRLWLA